MLIFCAKMYYEHFKGEGRQTILNRWRAAGITEAIC